MIFVIVDYVIKYPYFVFILSRYPIENPAGPAPDFLKFRGNTFSKTFSLVRKTVNQSRIATVCEEAKCPNRTECWSGGTATFMLMGDTCTRGCKFCAVKTSSKPSELNYHEPKNLVNAIKEFSNINYIVLTSVNRDDIDDGGATHFAKCITEVKLEFPDLKIEVLIPDFQGDLNSIQTIIDAKPDVIAHNIETVQRLTPIVRDRRATYDQSLKILKYIKSSSTIFTKSSIMVGFSETFDEVCETLNDLKSNDVDFITIGQYMRPTLKHLPVKKYLNSEEFRKYEEYGHELGFKYIVSKPLVRSSYKAGEFFNRSVN